MIRTNVSRQLFPVWAELLYQGCTVHVKVIWAGQSYTVSVVILGMKRILFLLAQIVQDASLT